MRIEDFMNKFISLKQQGNVSDDFACALLEQALQPELLREVLLTNSDISDWDTFSQSSLQVGRNLERLRIIRGGYTPGYNNSPGSSRFSATGTQPGAGAPMNISAAQQQRADNPQCYNCQQFGHIARNCRNKKVPHSADGRTIERQTHKGPPGHGLRGHEGLFCRFKRLEGDDNTGIIALEMDLDSAIRILNYRLSTSTSDSVSSIFKYRIALLTKKVTKTQKKVASIVSPLSVSNSFASLMVEDAENECTVDNVNTSHVCNLPRKSQEGPQKGSAGDSKKAVLNSLLTPFDVSKSPESINTEEPVLKLRRSVTIERKMKVPIEVQGPAFPIKVDTLLDSGATGCFIDKSWALE